MLRATVLVIVIAAALFGATSIYYRKLIDKRLRESTGEFTTGSRQSYSVFGPVMKMSNVLTLGKAQTAREQYIRMVTRAGYNSLSPRSWSLEPEAFMGAQQAVLTLDQIEDDLGVDLSSNKREILLAARDAGNRVLQDGTLVAWESMLNMFQYLDERGQIPEGVFPDFDAWYAEVQSVPIHELAVREAHNSSAHQLSSGLIELGLANMPQASGPLALPVPANITSQQLDQADRAFLAGRGPLERFQSTSPEVVPGELLELQGKQFHNHAVLLLNYLMQEGEVARTGMSGFLVEIYISVSDTRIPTAEAMYQDLRLLVEERLTGNDEGPSPYSLFAGAAEMGMPMAPAYAALSAWTTAMALDHLGKPDQASYWRRLAEQQAARVTEPQALEMLDRMRGSQRPLLIVHVPPVSPSLMPQSQPM